MQLLVLPQPDSKRPEILASVRQAFAEKGFDGASMQDLARAAGMSVGNFYRYFPSKSAIVAALIEGDLQQMQQDFEAMKGCDEPFQTLRDTIARRLPQHQSCDGQLWAEISAAAARKPEIAEAACRMEAEVLSSLLSVIAAETGLTADQARSRFSTEAAFLVLLIKSSAMVTPSLAASSDDLNRLILRTIDRTLSDISGAAASVPAFLKA